MVLKLILPKRPLELAQKLAQKRPLKQQRSLSQPRTQPWRSIPKS